MHFVDEVEIDIHAGDGGNGCVAFRREKFMPLGGPSGGDGGRGGDVILVVDEGLGSLVDLRYMKRIEAKRGEHGRGKDQYGKGGASQTIRVPRGTQVYDVATGEQLGDLSEHGERLVAARGGRGGRGNMHFITAYDRAPRRADPGEKGETRRLRLELKLLADVGIIGYPNVGKSTLISTASRAKPRVADYPFTTLTPNLGVVRLGVDRSFVMADIPGIIEGASDGAGLGFRFLKHVQRNRVLLHLITVDADPERDPLDDYDTLRKELRQFDEGLLSRPEIVALSRTDLPEVRDAEEEVRRGLEARGISTLIPFSSATREGLDVLLQAVEDALTRDRAEREADETPAPPLP